MSDIIQSLWIGGSLGKMEQLSAKSFIDHGHTYHLYTYGKVENIPEGVIVKDGNEIVPKSEIFRYKNGSLSAFSNSSVIRVTVRPAVHVVAAPHVVHAVRVHQKLGQLVFED